MNFIRNFKKVTLYKFVQDSAYTFVSYVILATSGIVANILIGNTYGAEGLGVFNQALALYMIFSLVAVFGLNTSVVKYVAQYNQEREIIKEIFTSASLLTLGFSVVLLILLWILFWVFPSIFFNKDVTKATSIIILSLPFFTQNKIFMALLNALRHMKAYSIIQSLRWLLILGFILFSIVLKKPNYFVFYSFLFSEVILLAFFILYYSKYFSRANLQSPWYKTHWIFGSKTVLLGFLSETNNRLDIFFISFFLSNYYVGIYSFAAEIAKGFLSIGSVIQLNVNPLVSQLWEKQDKMALRGYTQKISKMMFLILLSILAGAAIIYPLFVKIFMKSSNYLESIPVFYILLPGILIFGVYYFAGGYLSMANLLNIALKNSIIIIVYNGLACILFIRLFGFYGAAVSTSSTFIVTTMLLHFFVKRKMGISLINLKFRQL